MARTHKAAEQEVSDFDLARSTVMVVQPQVEDDPRYTATASRAPAFPDGNDAAVNNVYPNSIPSQSLASGLYRKDAVAAIYSSEPPYSNEDTSGLWVTPLDWGTAWRPTARRLLGITELVITAVIVLLGIRVAIRERRWLWQEKPYLLAYVIASLTSDLVLVLVGGFFLLCCFCYWGESSARHALASCTLCLGCFQGLSSFFLCGGGIYYLVYYYHPFLSLEPRKVELLLYLALETTVTTVYVISSLPSVLGACDYLRSKLCDKCRGRPVVVFLQPPPPPPHASHELEEALLGAPGFSVVPLSAHPAVSHSMPVIANNHLVELGALPDSTDGVEQSSSQHIRRQACQRFNSLSLIGFWFSAPS